MLIKKNFKEKVYAVVQKIPKGKVLTYKEVAELAGFPLAFRAVGNALNKNREKDVPCHRVVKSNGEIGGYAFGGQSKKAQILRSEGLNIKSFKVIGL